MFFVEFLLFTVRKYRMMDRVDLPNRINSIQLYGVNKCCGIEMNIYYIYQAFQKMKINLQNKKRFISGVSNSF